MTTQQAIAPGRRVRVTTHIPKGDGFLTTTYEGVVVETGQQKTGSWFAHSKDKKLWLERIELRMDDGERRICNLDQYTKIEVIG
ncbi:MAG: hypothetical protein KF866_09650 [Phycisphaeraceae bacterium]|nr:hypothetical protein [Phycisphaeraceae bacterium]MCW5754763.1 hypothetical protein [Phycisphaeraceae bacterium]